MRPNEQRKGIKNFSFIFSLYHFFSREFFCRDSNNMFHLTKKKSLKILMCNKLSIENSSNTNEYFFKSQLMRRITFHEHFGLNKNEQRREIFSFRVESSRVELSCSQYYTHSSFHSILSLALVLACYV